MATREETRVEDAKMTVQKDGEFIEISVPLTITDTFHDDGRKDVTIQVPEITTGSRANQEG